MFKKQVFFFFSSFRIFHHDDRFITQNKFVFFCWAITELGENLFKLKVNALKYFFNMYFAFGIQSPLLQKKINKIYFHLYVKYLKSGVFDSFFLIVNNILVWCFMRFWSSLLIYLFIFYKSLDGSITVWCE